MMLLEAVMPSVAASPHQTLTSRGLALPPGSNFKWFPKWVPYHHTPSRTIEKNQFNQVHMRTTTEKAKTLKQGIFAISLFCLFIIVW